ncbi:MAG: TAXI family TRAP transporter solute-binding subunit [Alphaproteobacteria bacterium]|nr:TAXI family TRAP transporter solute-binding subunit [Alphaproteobacteria bacterium]
MRNISKFALIGTAVAGIGAAASALASEPLRIGAMPVGSGWYVAASTLEKTLRPVVGDRKLEVIPRGGGVANPVVVDTGRAEIALSNVQTAQLAVAGDALYNGKKAENIRALVGGLNPVFLGAMVRNDFVQRTGLDTFDKIMASGKAVRILMKPQGSNVPPAVDAILAAYGLDRAKIKANGGDIIQVDVAQTPAIMRDGRADILIDTVLRGHPMITEVALTADVRFMDLSPKALDALAKVGVKPASIPEWFKGQSGPTKSGDFGTVLIAHRNLPENLAYQITKVVIEQMPEMAKNYPAWSSFKAEEAGKRENTGIALHPGAARYYKERGFSM